MMVLGMPSPGGWGLVAAVLNFIVHLGPSLVAVALAVAGQVVFDGGAALLPQLVSVSLNLIEGYFTAPFLVGRQVSRNPLVVFLSLSFWLWLWGLRASFASVGMRRNLAGSCCWCCGWRCGYRRG